MSIFPVVAPFEQLEADELARAEDVMYNFNLLRVWANALALPATGWGVDGHGDLSASTAQMHSATSVKVTDAGGYYTGGTVEAALQEAGADIAGLSTTIGSIGNFFTNGSDAQDEISVTVAAENATIDFLTLKTLTFSAAGEATYYMTWAPSPAFQSGRVVLYQNGIEVFIVEGVFIVGPTAITIEKDDVFVLKGLYCDVTEFTFSFSRTVTIT